MQRTPRSSPASFSAVSTKSTRRSERRQPAPWSSDQSILTLKFWSSASSMLCTSASFDPMAFRFNFQLLQESKTIGVTLPVIASGPLARVSIPPKSPFLFAWAWSPMDMKTTSVQWRTPGSCWNSRWKGSWRVSAIICWISLAVAKVPEVTTSANNRLQRAQSWGWELTANHCKEPSEARQAAASAGRSAPSCLILSAEISTSGMFSM